MMGNWNAGKREHVELSNHAADNYNQDYGSDNPATALYMSFEEDVIRSALGAVKNKNIALDLGSGTGRDSFVLTDYFDQVFGYDFSPRMVAVANSEKIRRRFGNVRFIEQDIETQPLPHDTSSVQYVNSGFGLASFVQSPQKLFSEVRRVLAPRGIALFSFYNSQSITENVDLPWSPSLSARLDKASDHLIVNLPDGTRKRISAKSYSTKGAQAILSPFFDIINLTTFPTISTLFPSELLQQAPIRELCQVTDKKLANDSSISRGHYIIAVCQKNASALAPRRRSGYQRSLDLLEAHRLTDSIVRHAPLKTMQDVDRVLAPQGVDRSQMLKSVLITTKPDQGNESRNGLPAWLIVVPANSMVDFGKLAKALKIKRSRLKEASIATLEQRTGFLIGGVPPYGMPRDIPVIFDLSVQKLSTAWCGTGDPCQSIQLPISLIEKFALASYANVSKKIKE